MRNDPCPCGSGKKYKKCCLKNVAVEETMKVIEERFFQLKHELVNKLNKYVNDTISFQEYNQLFNIFVKRTEGKINKNVEKGFFQFWLFFFYQAGDSRIIEKFAKLNIDKLSSDERELLKNWISLKPQLVQAIQNNEEYIVFENMFSKETYKVAKHKENVANSLPWFGSLSLLEAFNERFYFNGAKLFVEPFRLYYAKEKILSLVKEENITEEQVMMEYYPELIATLLERSNESKTEKKVEEITSIYEINNEESILDYFKQNNHFVQNRLDFGNHYTQVADWHEYEDSQLNGKVHLSEVKANILLRNNTMEITSFHRANIQDLEKGFGKLEIAYSKKDEKVKVLYVRETVEIKNFSIHIPEDAQEYFALYAQTQYNLFENKPILMFNSLTPHELIEAGRLDELDTWLKQEEYQIHVHLAKHFGKVDVTPDFNTYRKNVSLPLSTYVTDSKTRTSSLTKLSFEEKELVEAYQVLGFTPYTSDSFYAKDMLDFFIEKTEGKSKGTVRKYRNSLHDLREIFEATNCTTWETMNLAFWKKVMLEEFYNLYEYVSPTAEKDFVSVTKAFGKWIDEKYHTENHKSLSDVLK
ncbi:MAG: SEC-C domain-containing protein [Bacillaceae bacterium]|nr:SEC-C domain-containing protein [Bacillaceae bacterium]